MYCKRCQGNMYVDRVTAEGTRFDIACLQCGYRVFANAKTNSLAKLLYRQHHLGDTTLADGLK
jgi:DNA-directed RNA polymerase subunit RPC12/RpoP